MSYEDLETIIKNRFQARTEPGEPPQLSEWKALEARFGCRLPTELYDLRVLDARYWILGDHLPIAEILTDYEFELRENPNWSEDFIQFYAISNGDFLCVRRSECPQSGVYYVAHDDPEIQRLHSCVADYFADSDWFY